MRLGSDPEIFLVDPEGKHIAVNGYINAGKTNPLQIESMAPGFTLQEDNVALELGIPPAASSEEFQHHIRAVVEKSREWFPKELSFSRLSCVEFTPDQLRHPRARVFGCEPDYCVWTQKTNPKPKPPTRGTRSAGGHVHVETKLNPWEGGKAADLFLAIPAMKMDDGVARRQLYGKAGAVRIKPYGFEYRTLSNFWIFEDRLVDWVWRNMERAQEFIEMGDTVPEIVQEVINNDDQDGADKLIKMYDLEVL